ncbi:MAG: DUF4159 domain-containing protein [Cellvibrionaceae bacterium]
MKSLLTKIALLSIFLADSTLADPVSLFEGEFSFVRLRYDSEYAGGGFRFGSSWSIDYPAADENFLRAVTRLTNIKINSQPIVRRLDDEDIFNYPFLYALELGNSGGVSFNEVEMRNLREYLLRGGFLFIDDFWGTREWDNFYRTFSQVFPDRDIVELDSDHEIFRTFYDVDGAQMIPAMGNPQNIPEADVDHASNWAIMDDDGRIMVLINWNSDIGDGWEHTYHAGYPTRYANLAYRLGINYLIYALTH